LLFRYLPNEQRLLAVLTPSLVKHRTKGAVLTT
jgi:hypothetical protein